MPDTAFSYNSPGRKVFIIPTLQTRKLRQRRVFKQLVRGAVKIKPRVS